MIQKPKYAENVESSIATGATVGDSNGPISFVRRGALWIVAAGLLAAIVIVALWPISATHTLYLDDYAKCEEFKQRGFWEAAARYRSGYGPVYRSLTPVPLLWMKVACGNTAAAKLPALLLHLGVGVLLAIVVFRLTRVRLAAVAAGISWAVLPMGTEILAWPTTAAGYTLPASLGAAGIAVVLWDGPDLRQVSTRRWCAYALLAIPSILFVEQLALALPLFIGILALTSSERRRTVVRAALFAFLPTVIYLALVSATAPPGSGQSVGTGEALHNITRAFTSGGVWAYLSGFPGGRWWRDFFHLGANGSGGWVAVVTVLALVPLFIVIAAERVQEWKPIGLRTAAPVVAGGAAFVAAFLPNLTQAVPYVTARTFYLPNVFGAFTVGMSIAAILGVIRPKRARLPACLLVGSMLAIVVGFGAVVLRRDARIYHGTYVQEARVARAIATAIRGIPVEQAVQVAGIPGSWYVPGNDYVPIGEHIVNSMHIPWAAPWAVAHFSATGAYPSLTVLDAPIWCNSPDPKARLFVLTDRGTVESTTRTGLCGTPEVSSVP